MNVEKATKLYEFGALYVYEVSYFDPIAFKVKVEYRTFSEAVAKSKYDELVAASFKAEVRSYPVRFDGVWNT
jgi:hypothetical protein